MKRHILLCVPFIMLAGACAQHEKVEATADIDALSGLDPGKSEAQAQLTATSENDLYSNGGTKLIKTAHYRFQVENVKESTDAIIGSIRKYPAYISSSSLHLENPILENKITIRVQNEYFQDLLKEIDAQAKFTNRRDITTDDVSKDFVDLESRLKSKREVEARYMEILRKKAGTIEELLEAERQIGVVHEEIEATISRITYLRAQVSYSTINLEFYQTVAQPLQAGDEVTTKDKFTEALSSGWQGIVTITIALTYIWPLLIIAAATVIYIKLKKPFRKTLPL
jgi:molybdopterin converting factor small subunit